jgi:hypothetical protein
MTRAPWAIAAVSKKAPSGLQVEQNWLQPPRQLTTFVLQLLTHFLLQNRNPQQLAVHVSFSNEHSL